MRRLAPFAFVLVALLCATPAGAREKDDGVRVHRVRQGQVLGSIAKRYGVSVAAICRANGFGKKTSIRAGQRLIIPAPYYVLRGEAPEAQRAKKRSARGVKSRKKKSKRSARIRTKPAPKDASWIRYMKPAWRRGYVDIYGHGKSYEGYVIGPDDEVLPLARRRISRALASWRTGKHILIDERLVRLLAHVSDVFGGRRIRIVSGYRERSHSRSSRHLSGRAIDFSIPGIPNHALRDYLRTLDRVGVGYYPNSTHVHLDVRKKNDYWIDYSRPGRKPKYRPTIAARAPGRAQSFIR